MPSHGTDESPRLPLAQPPSPATRATWQADLLPDRGFEPCPATHELRNQPPPREGFDAYADDVALQEAVRREGAGWAESELHALGRLVGDQAWIERGRAANASRPELLTHDRYGNRIDDVRYHPAYHELMAAGVRHGLSAGPWATRDRAPTSPVSPSTYCGRRSTQARCARCR